MNHATSCPVEQLRLFVNDHLDESLHQPLIDHLDQCESCRRRIEAVAGPENDWALASEALSDVDLSESSLRGTVDEDARSLSSPDPLAVLSLLAPSDHPTAAGRIGPFEITGVIGSGGMGIVLKARDPALDRYVAIKLLAPHLASSSSARKRFAREARAAAAVIHDNVIAIYQVAHWKDLPYLVMPYLPDATLERRIEETSGLDLESSLSIALQIARGLSAAHTQGLVHRDVKPANVLLSKGTERAVITDFGLARASDDASLTRAGALAGTPHYMSPEQARGESVDQRSDLFSLGSVMFSMIAGRPPVDSDVGSKTIQQIAAVHIPSLESVHPQTPAWLIRLVNWLHAKRPSERPPSAEKVAEILEQCLAHVRQPNKTALPESLLPKKPPVLKWTVGSIAGVAILCVAALTTGILSPHRPDSPIVTSPANSGDKSPSLTSNASLSSNASSADARDVSWRDADEQISHLRDEIERLESALAVPWEPGSDFSSDPTKTPTPSGASQ